MSNAAALAGAAAAGMSKAADASRAARAWAETTRCIGTAAGRSGRAIGSAGVAARSGDRASFERSDGFNPQAPRAVEHGVHDHRGIARGFEAATVVGDIARAEVQIAADAADI